MIFGGLKPWETARQRHLLRACFHVNETKAEALATTWFSTFDLNDTSYPEHRLLVRLLNRFPNLALTATTASRLTGLKRQLWVRGHMNLKAAKSALDILDDFRISWVLTGAAQWFVQPKALANESADLVEICVPEPARSTALHLLAQNSWRTQYTTPETERGPVFTTMSKGQAMLKLSKAAPLFYLAPTGLDTLWETRVEQSHEAGIFFVPSRSAALSMALGRTHPKFGHSDQWVFDLFNQSPDPRSLLAGHGYPAQITRTLRKEFYR